MEKDEKNTQMNIDEKKEIPDSMNYSASSEKRQTTITNNNGSLNWATSNEQQAINENGNFYNIAGFMMAILGVIVSFYLFSNARSGWSGLDNKMIIGGIIILVYQGILSSLCFKVSNFTKRIENLEKNKEHCSDRGAAIPADTPNA